MINKVSQHFNKGMNRDLSDSKVSNEFAYENHNIRITENNGDTLLSVTNEQGNTPINLYGLRTINKLTVTQGHDDEQNYDYNIVTSEYPVASNIGVRVHRRTGDLYVNHIYTINKGETSTERFTTSWTISGLDKEEDYEYLYYIDGIEERPADPSGQTTIQGKYCGHCVVAEYLVIFTMIENSHINNIYRINKGNDDKYYCQLLYSGNLNITPENPLECIGDYQTENVIKVYWIDGVNQTRLINILDKNFPDFDDTSFDFSPTMNSEITIVLSNNYDIHGEFPSGIIQYFITGISYSGAESAILASSDLLHLKLKDRDLGPQENYNYSVDISINIANKDNFRKLILYSMERTSYNGEAIARKVAELENNQQIYTDNGNAGEAIAITDLFYKNGETPIAQAIDYKDNVLFLGNITVESTKMSDELINRIKDINNYTIQQTSRTIRIENPYQCNPYLRKDNYYRIGIQFRDNRGKWSSAFFISDVQIETPVHVNNNGTASVGTISVLLNRSLREMLMAQNFNFYRILIVLPEETDRVVFSQGILNSNVFNISDRNNGSADIDSSWFFRPICANSSVGQECRPYRPIKYANSLYAEIQSQNQNDFDYCFYNEDKALSQYIIDPYVYDFYSPDLRDINGESVWDNLHGSLVGYCELSGQDECQYNSRATTTSPYGMKPAHCGFVKDTNNLKNTGYYGTNVLTAFMDGLAPGNDVRSLKEYNYNQMSAIPMPPTGKGYLMKITNDLGSAASLTYAIYPWHRDSSLNNDIPREGRTAILGSKVFSKYLYFNTNYINEPVSFDLESPLYFFDNNVDFLVLKYQDNNQEKTIKYRGNVNTIVSNKAYPTPIYIGEYQDNKTIEWYDSEDSDPDIHTISSKYIRSPELGEKPINLVPIDQYGVIKEDGDYVDHIGYDQDNAPFVKNISVPWSVATLTYPDSLSQTTVAASMDPVSIKYKTSNHCVFKMERPIWFTNEGFNPMGECAYFAGAISKQDVANYSQSDLPLLDSGISSSSVTDILWLINLTQDINTDTLFGGKTDFALKNNRWIIASTDRSLDWNSPAEVNTGDTYLYRWDCLKTFPYANGDKNSVVEIGSFMLESYKNNQSRYDRNQNSNDYTTMNESNFGLYNDVYNQKNNLFSYSYLTDEFLTTNKFPNQFIWSLEHTPGAEIDNWTNMSYGSFYNVNGDNGEIRAIRRYGNTLLGFQDSGIFEILYNSRTQISTTNGLPIELANSGKVDGVRYLTEEEGCVNKWSINITQNGLYFIDDLNYSINLLAGNSINRLSDNLGFAQWCKDNIVPYKMWTIDNGGFRTYYDRINNDVYFAYGDKSLVYSEKLAQFMSFMDYTSHYALENLKDDFIAFNNELWANRTGEYNSFFGIPRDYYVQYRIAPDAYLNKTFHTIDYVLSSDNKRLNYTDLIVDGVNQHGESDLTSRPSLPPFNLQKKFNVWRANIPREQGKVLNRIQSPWIYLTLKSDKNKRLSEEKTELHNLIVKYSV